MVADNERDLARQFSGLVAVQQVDQQCWCRDTEIATRARRRCPRDATASGNGRRWAGTRAKFGRQSEIDKSNSTRMKNKPA
jgi:hypothetical protein